MNSEGRCPQAQAQAMDGGLPDIEFCLRQAARVLKQAHKAHKSDSTLAALDFINHAADIVREKLKEY